MSIQVTLPELARTLTKFPFAYLVSVGDDGRPRIVAVTPSLDGDTLILPNTGRSARANVAARPAVTLVWPPTSPTEFSLIVDGVASLREDAVAVAFSSGVLHRPAVAEEPAAG